MQLLLLQFPYSLVSKTENNNQSPSNNIGEPKEKAGAHCYLVISETLLGKEATYKLIDCGVEAPGSNSLYGCYCFQCIVNTNSMPNHRLESKPYVMLETDW